MVVSLTRESLTKITLDFSDIPITFKTLKTSLNTAGLSGERFTTQFDLRKTNSQQY